MLHAHPPLKYYKATDASPLSMICFFQSMHVLSFAGFHTLNFCYKNINIVSSSTIYVKIECTTQSREWYYQLWNKAGPCAPMDEHVIHCPVHASMWLSRQYCSSSRSSWIIRGRAYVCVWSSPRPLINLLRSRKSERNPCDPVVHYHFVWMVN